MGQNAGGRLLPKPVKTSHIEMLTHLTMHTLRSHIQALTGKHIHIFMTVIHKKKCVQKATGKRGEVVISSKINAYNGKKEKVLNHVLCFDFITQQFEV